MASIDNDSSANFFQFSVTEFVLILAFFFLVLAAVYQGRGKQMEDEAISAVKTRQDVLQLARQFNELSEKLSLERVDLSGEPERMLVEVRERIEQINGYVSEPLDIREDWETLVYIKRQLDEDYVSSDSLRELADKAREVDEVKSQLEKVEKNLQSCANEFDHQRKRCGTGYPICGGSGTFLAKLTVGDNTVGVAALLTVEGIARPLEQRIYSYDEFIQVGDGYYDYSTRQLPECRFQVRVVDDTSPTAKKAYKRAIDVVDDRFYKVEVSQ